MSDSWGMKVSQTGYDVKTADFVNLIQTSAKTPVKLLLSGTATITIPSTSDHASTFIFVPFIPNSAAAPIVTAVLNGKRYLSQLPSSFGSIISPTDYHAMSAYSNTPISITSSGVTYNSVSPVQITITRDLGGISATSGQSEIISVRYFIIAFSTAFTSAALS